MGFTETGLVCLAKLPCFGSESSAFSYTHCKLPSLQLGRALLEGLFLQRGLLNSNWRTKIS